jgi:hypothetical protein
VESRFDQDLGARAQIELTQNPNTADIREHYIKNVQTNGLQANDPTEQSRLPTKWQTAGQINEPYDGKPQT